MRPAVPLNSLTIMADQAWYTKDASWRCMTSAVVDAPPPRVSRPPKVQVVASTMTATRLARPPSRVRCHAVRRRVRPA